ncbi:hypothetical protein SteCoe_36640 [Stentor coeruleus]|uniref:Uncharacterized protein n=1 Tax=Stentor coeruleus TaxID=5963 RepID=A0A1R2APQ1_9CILI|nr:hypothetical protein SteCoe_36640 [Stentor coeruleus]
MLNSKGFTEENPNYPSQYLGRLTSPRILTPRSSPRLADPTLSPYSITINDHTNISDFINSIQNQLKRIYPVFSFQFSSDPPLAQAINFLTQAVDRILAERGNNSKPSPEKYDGSVDYDTDDWLKEDIEKAKQATKNLARYEKLLKKKEEKLEEEKTKFRCEKQDIKDLEEHLQQALNNFELQQKAWLDSKRSEQEKLKVDKEDMEIKLAEAKILKEKYEKKIDESAKHLKHEKDILLQLENCLNHTKQTLAIDQKRIAQERLELEKEKWKLDQKSRKLEEDEVLLKVKFEHLDQEKLVVESEKIKLQTLRKEIHEEQNTLTISKEKTSISEKNIKKASFEESLQSDKLYQLSNQDYESKIIELNDREIEIEHAYKDLQEQMDKFNKELEDRENILDEREFLIEKQEKDNKKKFDNFFAIESSLAESKIQVEDLRTFTIPELEKQSGSLSSLMNELIEKKQKLDLMIEKLNKELTLLEKHKEDLSGNENTKNEKDILEENDYNICFSKDIENITLELEQKLVKVKERELELDHAQMVLDNDRYAVTQAAEFLKKAHVENEEQRKKNEQEILEEKNKLKIQFIKLESGMKLLSTKEAEVYSLKRKLEEKSQMLGIKEKEFKASMKNLHSKNSSIVEEKDDDV